MSALGQKQTYAVQQPMSALHNWNFDRDENKNFILWRGAEKYNINADLSDFVEGHLTELPTEDGPELIFAGYRKAI